MDLENATYNEHVELLKKGNRELRKLKVSSKDFGAKALEVLAVKDSISRIKQSVASTGSA